MNDRGMKKWRPFNSVVSSKELLMKPANDDFPDITDDEIQEYEEILKKSMYTHSKIRITYIENASKKVIEDFVVDLDPIKKNVILKTKKINFRQIYKVNNARK